MGRRNATMDSRQSTVDRAALRLGGAVRGALARGRDVDRGAAAAAAATATTTTAGAGSGAGGRGPGGGGLGVRDSRALFRSLARSLSLSLWASRCSGGRMRACGRMGRDGRACAHPRSA